MTPRCPRPETWAENGKPIPFSQTDIEALLACHVAEYFRLLEVPTSEQERKRKEFLESWPYAPHLLQLLEDQVLVATDAQETRDMIRILANLFKSRGEGTPILTASDFRLDDDAAGIGALLDSVSNQQHRSLRDKALRNITSVMEAVSGHESIAPHLQELVGALWLRSIAVGNHAGAEAEARLLQHGVKSIPPSCGPGEVCVVNLAVKSRRGVVVFKNNHLLPSRKLRKSLIKRSRDIL